jgi:hypothetical protein
MWNALLIAGIAICCASSVALAAKNSLVDIVRDVQCCGQKGVFYSTTFPGEVITVGSTTPVSSIMIPANRLTAQFTSYTSGPFTPYQTRVVDRRNLSGTFVPGNPNAPAGPTTFSAATSTTLCTVSPVPGGSCQPRYGLAKISPTATKFGGTLRIVDDGYNKGLFKSGAAFYYFRYEFNPTPRLQGPMYVGGYGIAGSGKVTNTALPSVMNVSSFQTTEGPFTTGQVYVYHSAGQAVTKITSTGYDNRTPTTGGNVKGTVSLVRPTLTHAFLRDSATDPVFDTGPPFGVLDRVRITFLPEPLQLLSLGCCVLAMGVLYRSRGR